MAAHGRTGTRMHSQKTVEKLVNATAHCCYAVTPPLTVPLAHALPYLSAPDGRLAPELETSLPGRVDLLRFSFEFPLISRTLDFAN